jgi:hypothetical protein
MAAESGLSRNRRYKIWDTEKASLNKLQTNKQTYKPSCQIPSKMLYGLLCRLVMRLVMRQYPVRVTVSPDWGVSWFSSASPGQCRTLTTRYNSWLLTHSALHIRGFTEKSKSLRRGNKFGRVYYNVLNSVFHYVTKWAVEVFWFSVITRFSLDSLIFRISRCICVVVTNFLLILFPATP